MTNQALIPDITDKSVLQTAFGSILRISWSPDSKYFAVLQTTKAIASIVVYSAETHEVIRELSLKKSGSYSGSRELLYEGSLAFSPDGKFIAGGVGIVTLWDVNTWQEQKEILGPFSRGDVAKAVNDIVFSPDGKTLTVFYDSVLWPESITVSSDEDRMRLVKDRKADKSIHNAAAIMAFDIETTSRCFLIKQENTSTRSVMFSGNLAYSSDGRYMVSTQDEKIPVSQLTKDDDPLKHFTFLKFRDPVNGYVLKEIENLHAMAVTAVAFSHDSKVVATGTSTTNKEAIKSLFSDSWHSIQNEDPIRLWDVTTGKKIMEFGPIRGGVKALAFSPDDKTLLSCQTDIDEKEIIWLWDIPSGELIQRIAVSDSGINFQPFALSPDGKIVAVPVLNRIYFIRIKNN